MLTDRNGIAAVPLDECWFAVVKFGPPQRPGSRPCAVCGDGKLMRPARGCWVEIGREYRCLCFETERAVICIPLLENRPSRRDWQDCSSEYDEDAVTGSDVADDAPQIDEPKPKLPAPDRRGPDSRPVEPARAVQAAAAPPKPKLPVPKRDEPVDRATDSPKPKLPAPDRNAPAEGVGQAKPVKRPSADPISAIDRYKARYGNRPPMVVATPTPKKSGDDSPKKPVAPPKTFAEALAKASGQAPSK